MSDYAANLEAESIGCKLKRPQFSKSRAVNQEQLGRIAHEFGASSDFISAAKQLLDTKHEAYRAVTTIRSQAVSYWQSTTLPYPDEGVRLLRRARVDDFSATMDDFAEQLRSAAEDLDAHYGYLQSEARERLGELYSVDDYPSTLSDRFGLIYSFPPLSAPEYLKQLSPRAWEQECERVRAQFTEAVELAEQAFLGELNSMVSHMVERLSGRDDDGKPKTFRNSMLENLRDFFGKFSELNVGSNAELNDIVGAAQSALNGVTPGELRENQFTRERLRAGMSNLAGRIDSQMIVAPSRRIRVSRQTASA